MSFLHTRDLGLEIVHDSETLADVKSGTNV